MQKPLSLTSNQTIFSKVKHNILSYFEYPHFDLQPLMPRQQVSQFIAAAANKKYPVRIQFNASDNIDQIEGVISSAFSSDSIVIYTSEKDLYHILSIENIRNIQRF